jgi:hypothetical protein
LWAEPGGGSRQSVLGYRNSVDDFSRGCDRHGTAI